MSEIVGVKLQINGEEKIVKSVGEMRKLLKEAQFEALALSSEFGETSKEALEAAKRVAMLKDSIQDTSERIGLFDPGKKFQVFANTISTAAGGVAALQGAMGLFGAESEAVQQSLLKVQSALALSQGLSVIADGAKDFQRLGAFIQQSTIFIKANELATKAASITMKLFGVSVETTSVSFKVLKGAIAATGIGLLVIGLAEAISYMQNFTSATEDAAKAQEELNKKIAETAKNALTAEQTALDNNTKLLVARAKAAGKSEEEIFKIEQDGRRLKAQALQRYYDEVKGADTKAAEEAKNALDSANIEALVAQANYNESKRKQQEAEDKKAEEKRKADLEKRLAEEKKTQELIDEARKRNISARPESITATQDQVLEDEQAARDAEVKAEEEKQAKILAAQQRTLEGRTSILLQDQANQQAISDANIETARKEAEAKEVLLQTTASALTNLSMVAGRETVAGKALAIASSIINTYQGATKALAQGGIAGPIAAAGIIAAGLAAVKQIVSVKIPNQSGGGMGVNAPSLNTQSPLNPTTIAANQVTLDQRSINAIGNKAIRAYVIESEITSAQQKIRRIQRQTTFG
jgi:chemotaxis protein histidine kinase CheA